MEWVNINDRLPEEDIMCLCYCEGEPIVKYIVASYYKKEDCFIDYEEYPYNITHWKSLPKQPSDGEMIPQSGSNCAIPIISMSIPSQYDIELEARQSAEELPEHTAKERYYYKVGFNRGANFAIRTSVYSR